MEVTRVVRGPVSLVRGVQALAIAAMFMAPVRVSAQAGPRRARPRRPRSVDTYDPNRPSPAGEPDTRTYSDENGMTAAPVLALAQDSIGFLWIGGVGGLFRYDGHEFRHWAPNTIATWVGSIAVSPSGAVAAVSAEPAVFRVTDGGARRLPTPPGGWQSPAVRVAFDGAGRLWVTDGRLLRYDSAHAVWRTFPMSAFRGDTVRRVCGGAGPDGVYVATDGGVWLAEADGTTTELWRGTKIVDLATSGAEGLLILQIGGRVTAYRNGVAHKILADDATPYARAISVTERRGTIWVAFDRYLASVQPGGRPSILGPADGLESGGPLLVDRDGSLWLGTFESLVQYPEPRTRRWSDRQGLPSQHVRYLARSGADVAVVTWQGLGFLEHERDGWRASHTTEAGQEQPCTLADGSLLLSATTSWVRIRDTAVIGTLGYAHVALRSCVPASDGGRWLATSRGLLHLRRTRAPAAGGELRLGDVTAPLAQPPLPRHDLENLAVDSAGDLWISAGDSVCHAPEVRLLKSSALSWSCIARPSGVIELTSLVALPGGGMWASSVQRGVFRLVDHRWQPIPGASALPTQSVLHMVPSRSGGIWVVGHGFVWRVMPRPDRPDGWQVVEKLTGWDGITSRGAGDLIEDADGGVWIGTDEGVVHVATDVRRTHPTPPPVVLVEARADGRALPLGPPIVLSHGHNRLELHFAALSFRDPASLRYEVRLSPHDAWAPVSGAPAFRWLGLAPGTYDAQVRASLDGVHWSATPAALRFRVNPPWYLEPQIEVLGVAMLVVLLVAAYRLRVAYLVGLERQRTRIAMDLHDEVGSGLASVAILSGVLADDRLTATEARGAAGDIARTAEELGDSLADIVWSLQPGEVTLETLAARLAEQGARLFADGNTRFNAPLPAEYPHVPLDLSLLRTVLLVGLEALHNASKYAQATNVTLALQPEDDAWVLEITDDGVGMSPEDLARARGGTAAVGGSGRHGGGHGLPGMRRRAEESGATLTIESTRSAGTIVRLRFRLQRRGWWDRLWLRIRGRRGPSPT